MNIYKQILKENINKLLNLYNTDINSPTFGYGDREFWAWKTKDFTNATLQGGVHSLAIALHLNLFNENEKKVITDIIDSAICAIKNIMDKNGSVVEAYPRENSFCVTALVAFDVLSCVKYLENTINTERKKQYLEIVKPLINFISKNDEEHAIISNHLATGVAAVTLWNNLTNDKNQRANELLKVIYDNQSDEGWYKEYEGADPGYQTLCTYYLFCVYEITKDEKLLQSLKKSAIFLSHFVHPDGTIGGLYGSRNTEVFYPAGVIALSSKIEEFSMMSKCLEPKEQHILPQNIDIGNYIPLLNSYAVAALYYESSSRCVEDSTKIPFFVLCSEKDFKKAGIFLISNNRYFAIINYKKGGVIKVFDKQTRKLDLEDGGLFGRLENGTRFSSQQFDDNIDFKDRKIQSNFYKTNISLPNPFNFLILRVLSITVFRSVYLGNLFKKMIVNMLMTGKNVLDGQLKREFYFLKDKIVIKEKIVLPSKSIEAGHSGKIKAIHMASSGYFISQNFYNQNSKLVEFKNV